MVLTKYVNLTGTPSEANITGTHSSVVTKLLKRKISKLFVTATENEKFFTPLDGPEHCWPLVSLGQVGKDWLLSGTQR